MFRDPDPVWENRPSGETSTKLWCARTLGFSRGAAKDSAAAPRLMLFESIDHGLAAVATIFRRSAAESGSLRIPPLQDL
jgi:hypothetical protein